MNAQERAELDLIRKVRRLSPKGGMIRPPRRYRNLAIREALNDQLRRAAPPKKARAKKERERVLLRVQRTQMRAEERAAEERRLVHVVRMGDID